MPDLKTKATTYQQLIKGKVWIGGLRDVSSFVEKERCDVVIDLRAEKMLTGKENPQHYMNIPLVEGQKNQEMLIHEAVETIAVLVEHGHKVAIHCSAGRSRTGSVAIGVLIRLGLAGSVNEAEQLLQELRPETHVHEELKASLYKLYPSL